MCKNCFLDTPKSAGDDVVSVRTQQITTSRQLLISAADAIERIMSSYKEVRTVNNYHDIYCNNKHHQLNKDKKVASMKNRKWNI